MKPMSKSNQKSKWLVVAILALAQFVMVLDSTVMNVSISKVVQDLNTTVSALQSAITFYTLTMAAFMLLGAKLCAKWGLLRAFVIGSVVYGIGSLLTGLSPNITTLFLGWSIIEGLGAVLVIPAIAALIAINYKGKDRVVAYAIIGGISGAAAAAGPLIGGFMTTYLSWRYVFIAETIVMLFVLIMSRRFEDTSKPLKIKIDLPSVFLSVTGMVLLVYGMLQSKTWGWITPMAKPSINGHSIAPLGISIVAYLIIGGLFVMKLFIDRQTKLENLKRNPLVQVSMLKIAQLQSGLAVLMSQYVVTAAVFFVVPIYLQMVLGLDALKTGIKIFPLSVALIIFSILGSKMVNRKTPKQIVRVGQWLLVVGSVCLLAAIDPELTGYAFALSMFAVGAGLGLLASQLGAVNMSAVDESKSSEVGGLSGTFQNLGSSFGTALIGSMMVLALTSSFMSSITNNPSLPDNVKSSISEKAQQTGVPIVSAASVEQSALSNGLSEQQASQLSSDYESSQLFGLKRAIFVLIIITLLSIMLSKSIPDKVIKSSN
jgi:MFS family permease